VFFSSNDILSHFEMTFKVSKRLFLTDCAVRICKKPSHSSDFLSVAVHRVADAAPKTREAYLKGDFGLKRAVMEARAEDEGLDGEGSRGGKRGAKKAGGTKEQRQELSALADYIAQQIKGFKPSKNPIKTEWTRLGSDPWQVMIVVRHKPLAPEPGEDTSEEKGGE